VVSWHYVFVADDDEIRQGDIIMRRTGKDTHSLGVIVTADCDIAQNKAGDRLTWLEIVSSQRYLNEIWAVEQLRRLARRQSKICCERINSILAKSETPLGYLSEASLVDWLRDEEPRAIVEKLRRSSGAAIDNQFVNTLSATRTALGLRGSSSSLDQLREAWTFLGRSSKSQQATIREAFDVDRGFPDYLLVPELPNVDGVGYTILLRAISSLNSNELFKNEADARSAGSEHSFFRIGRFNDTTRHAIAQKLAFLFSRIGLPSSFEDECATATDLLIEAVYGAVE
jgi:hypothetical protein